MRARQNYMDPRIEKWLQNSAIQHPPLSVRSAPYCTMHKLKNSIKVPHQYRCMNNSDSCNMHQGSRKIDTCICQLRIIHIYASFTCLLQDQGSGSNICASYIHVWGSGIICFHLFIPVSSVLSISYLLRVKGRSRTDGRWKSAKTPLLWALLYDYALLCW